MKPRADQDQLTGPRSAASLCPAGTAAGPFFVLRSARSGDREGTPPVLKYAGSASAEKATFRRRPVSMDRAHDLVVTGCLQLSQSRRFSIARAPSRWSGPIFGLIGAGSPPVPVWADPPYLGRDGETATLRDRGRGDPIPGGRPRSPRSTRCRRAPTRRSVSVILEQGAGFRQGACHSRIHLRLSGYEYRSAFVDSYLSELAAPTN